MSIRLLSIYYDDSTTPPRMDDHSLVDLGSEAVAHVVASSSGTAVELNIYQAGETVPSTGNYRTICADLVTQALTQEQQFAVCPQCMAPSTGWLPL